MRFIGIAAGAAATFWLIGGAGQALAQGAGTTFKDCAVCPEMVVMPRGSFIQGAPRSEQGSQSSERPQRTVNINYDFAVSKFEVTFAQWDACHAQGGCSHRPDDYGYGRRNRPVIDVSWDDAQEYLAWLTRKTKKTYRLLTESEWEYAARAGTQTRWHCGDTATCLKTEAWFKTTQSKPVGRKAANAFGLHDMHGNVYEWVEDCYIPGYAGAPTDGSARRTTPCYPVLRGGNWSLTAPFLRSAARLASLATARTCFAGFRVARTLPVAVRQ